MTGDEKRPTARILIADDNRDAGETLALLLEGQCYEVLLSDNGRSALELALEFRPDAGIFDLGMPGMTGLELAGAIRQESWGQRAVLIALTGWGAPQDREAAYAAGFNHHLTKPANLDDITTLLLRAFPSHYRWELATAQPGLTRRTLVAIKNRCLKPFAQSRHLRHLAVTANTGHRPLR